MPQIHVTTTIDRSREDVFDFVADPANQMLWNSGLVEFEPEHDGMPSKGDHSRGVVKVAGRRIEWTSEVTDIERPERISFRSVEAPFPFEFTIELRDADGATEVVYSGATESMKGFFGKLADPFVAKMYERDMKSNLDNLKSLLEEDAASS